MAMLASRFLATCGMIKIIREYGVEITLCEGPSMMPTIQSSGDIVLIERLTHRIYGIDGGTNGEQRAKDAKARQKEFELLEHKKWLSCSPRSKNDLYEPSWHVPKFPQVTHENHRYLSSFSKSWSKMTSGIAVGDVVVLQHPEKDGTICKRVLGLPGDIILQPRRSSYISAEHREVMNIFSDDENKDDEKVYRNDYGSKPLSSSLSNSRLTVVPDGHIWIEGDNSLNSVDSRDYGAVSANLVLGKVWMRLWPIRGDAFMVRGDRPVPNGAFTGSTVVPAGCEGEARRVMEPLH